MLLLEDCRICEGMMGKGLKNCAVASHQTLKNQAKNRVDDLQLTVNKLQLARKENRAGDVAELEERVNEVLREWKAELDGNSPASSFLEESLGSFAELLGSLQQCDVEDDATSLLSKPPLLSHGNEQKQALDHLTHGFAIADSARDNEVYYLNHTPQHGIQNFQNHAAHYLPQQQDLQGFENHVASQLTQQHEFQGFDSHTQQQHTFQNFELHNGTPHVLQGHIVSRTEASDPHNLTDDNLHIGPQSDYLHSDVHQNFDSENFLNTNDIEQWDLDVLTDFSGVLPNVNPPASAFLRPTCALWDCMRPAQVSDFCNNYCSSFHAELAVKECLPGTAPILRPGGIGLKDGPLILALKSKIEGKDVGIPECSGAVTAQSPWKAPELFDLSMLEGEKIREWLFFDKPRRAFETGLRKQRSFSDYDGRWHESRKLNLSEYGGRKRSYYADPQPQEHFEWHLYEYEIENYDTFALYRLELKVAEGKKKSPKSKSPKSKVANDPLTDLQKRMDRLTAVISTDDKPSGKGKAKNIVQSDVQNVAS